MKIFSGWILPLIVAVAVALAAWYTFRDRIYEVGGDSMSPTLTCGQKVWVEYGGAIRRNDIVLVVNPLAPKNTASLPVLKRCVCMPGDSITRLQTMHLYGPAVVPRSGQKVHLDYANYLIYKDLAMKYEDARMEWRDSICIVDGKVAESYTFKRDYVFLINDNRADHSDSRTFGPVPRDWIGAKIKFVF
jgi:signal peptidase I